MRKADATVDHMIPQYYIAQMRGSGRRTDFRSDWNVQPMCPKCNQARGGYMRGWPLFRCRCHALEIAGEDMFVWEAVSRERQWTRHLLATCIVRKQYGQAAQISLIKMPPDGKHLGWHQSLDHLPLVPSSLAPSFGWFEGVRVGDATIPMVQEYLSGRFTFFPDGTVLDETGACTNCFDPVRGHRNYMIHPRSPGRIRNLTWYR